MASVGEDLRDELAHKRRREAEAERREAEQRPPRKAEQRLSVALMAQAVPGLPRYMVETFEKEVPAEFCTQTAAGVVMVACPCGGEPEVEVGGLASCTCDRAFLHTGSKVLVGRPEGEDQARS